VPDSYKEPYGDLQGIRRTYAGMLAAMDEGIGQILAALEEEKMTENTLVIFSSDNGGPSPGKVTDNGPLRAGKGTIYEGGVRVCACVSWPGKIKAGTRIAEPLHGVDWYPTLLKIAGAPLEQKHAVDGRDILPVLVEGAKSPHEVILHCGMSPGVAALRMGDWKLVVHGRAGAGEGKPTAKGKKKGQAGGAERVELFNLKEDLGEKKDLAAENPEKVAELRGKMEKAFEGAVGMGER